MTHRTKSRLAVAATIFGLVTLGACSRDGAPTARPLPADKDLAASLATKHITRDELAAHRRLQLERLHTYALAGRFPQNPSASPEPIHMFRDAQGNRCPIANLIYEDGHVALVDRMAREHNDVVVADETSGPLHEWVLTSGLTNEEVRRIQGVGFPGEGRLVAAGSLAPSVIARLDLLAHLEQVEKELQASTDASLDLAMLRLEHPALAAL